MYHKHSCISCRWRPSTATGRKNRRARHHVDLLWMCGFLWTRQRLSLHHPLTWDIICKNLHIAYAVACAVSCHIFSFLCADMDETPYQWRYSNAKVTAICYNSFDIHVCSQVVTIGKVCTRGLDIPKIRRTKFYPDPTF